MRAETKEWLALIGKTFLFIVGGILTLAAAVELTVGGPFFEAGDGIADTFSRSAGLVLLVGLAMTLPPLAFAFRDALREARKPR